MKKKTIYLIIAVIILAYAIAEYVFTGNYYPLCITLVWSVLILAFLGYKKYGVKSNG